MESDIVTATEIDEAGPVPEDGETGPTETGPRLDRKGKVKLTALLVFLAALAVWIIGTSKTGAGGDPRIENPDPQGSVLVNGVWRHHEPFLGVDNWPMVFTVGFLVFATLVLTPFVLKSWRQRKPDHGLIIFAAVAVIAWLDPVQNWATFTIYNPELPHFPTEWFWMRFSPSVEPIIVVPGYPFYYFFTALLATGGYRRYVLPRVKPSSFFRRHPRWGMFIVGIGIGFAWDIPVELFQIRAGIYFYAQSFGPVVRWGGTHSGLPIIWTTMMVFTIAVIAVLLYRDDDGGSSVTSLARRLPGRRAQSTDGEVSTGRQFLAAVLLLSAAYAIPFGVFAGFRVAGLADNTYSGDEWPYPEIMTYDPYGTLEDAGKPGPYFTG